MTNNDARTDLDAYCEGCLVQWLFTSVCLLIYLFKTDLPIIVLREINSSDDNNNCKDLIIEIQRMRRVKGKVIPEIKRATGTVLKSLVEYPSNISRKHEIKEL